MNPEKTNSLVGQPVMGVEAYGSAEFAKPASLDAKSPVMGGSASVGGDYVPASLKTASTTNSDTSLNTTASNENLSAKYKYPQVSQDTVPQNKVAKAGSNI